jgi:hypothetical protein
VYSFGKKLTSIAALDEFLYIGHGRRPVETCSEGFANQGPRGGVIAASTTVNFVEQLDTYFASDTIHQNLLLCIFCASGHH